MATMFLFCQAISSVLNFSSERASNRETTQHGNSLNFDTAAAPRLASYKHKFNVLFLQVRGKNIYFLFGKVSSIIRAVLRVCC